VSLVIRDCRAIELAQKKCLAPPIWFRIGLRQALSILGMPGGKVSDDGDLRQPVIQCRTIRVTVSGGSAFMGNL